MKTIDKMKVPDRHIPWRRVRERDQVFMVEVSWGFAGLVTLSSTFRRGKYIMFVVRFKGRSGRQPACAYWNSWGEKGKAEEKLAVDALTKRAKAQGHAALLKHDISNLFF